MLEFCCCGWRRRSPEKDGRCECRPTVTNNRQWLIIQIGATAGGYQLLSVKDNNFSKYLLHEDFALNGFFETAHAKVGGRNVWVLEGLEFQQERIIEIIH